MATLELINEPIELIFSEILLSGNSTKDKLELDVKLVIDEFFEQGYGSISELLTEEVSTFRFDDNYEVCDEIVDKLLFEKNDLLKEKYIKYRKVKLKKENSKFDDFFFSVFDEVYNNLRIIAIYRAMKGINEASPLEKLFSLYKDGLFPYRFIKGEFSVYNPICLKSLD